MQIQQLRLQNFRGIKHLELNFDLSERFAVLVGVNGVGKSSILDCISAMVRSYGLIADTHRSAVLSQDQGRALIIPTNEGLKSIFQDRDIHFGETLTCNGLSAMIHGTEIRWEIKKTKGAYCEQQFPDNDSKESIEGSSYHYDASRFVAVCYSANRTAIQINYERKPIHEYPDSSSNSLNIIDFREFTNWFQRLENLENETRLLGDNSFRDLQLEATRKAIYSMLGDGFSDLRMKRAIDKLTIHKMGKEIELDWLSDGERGLLALAGDLARRLAITYPNSPDPLQGEGLVLIDEIELHLHPAWQHIIIQRLTQTFPNCQFIVTTHSPQVLGHIQPECIHNLVMDGENVVVERPERSYGRDSNRMLEDIMGVSQRPPEIEEKISEIFRMIHDGDAPKAKELIQDLASKIGIDEPELIRATSAIRRREVLMNKD
jgi:predicted ATP-binding protein involved in virulence